MAKTDVLQGTLTLLVLKTLSRGPAHGYAITQHIQNVSRDLLRVEEGSLYPALHRMEQAGWIEAAWAITELNRRARFYTLTGEGRKRLKEEESSWERLATGVREILFFA
jgi:PadR family transcriptional regulator, regulatory protein PadR